VKFLIDAQLPRRLARWLNDRGFDAIHTLESLIDRHWASIHAALGNSCFVELSTIGLVVHH